MRYNTSYGKVIDGELRRSPNKLIIGKEQVFNAPAEAYAAQGWLPIKKSDAPEDEEGYYHSPVYIEEDGSIVQRWERHEISGSGEATETDYIEALESLGVSFDE